MYQFISLPTEVGSSSSGFSYTFSVTCVPVASPLCGGDGFLCNLVNTWYACDQVVARY